MCKCTDNFHHYGSSARCILVGAIVCYPATAQEKESNEKLKNVVEYLDHRRPYQDVNTF